MNRQTVIGVLIVILIATAALAYGQFSRAPTPTEDEVATFVTGSLSIENVLPKTEVSAALDSTALSLLSEVAQEMVFEIRTKEYPGMGVLVEKIGDVENGEGGKYWHFYVNGKLAPVGASDYVIQANDVIDWKFTEPDTSY